LSANSPAEKEARINISVEMVLILNLVSKSLNYFSFSQSRMSKLSSKKAIDLSKKIKISAWKKIKKELKL